LFYSLIFLVNSRYLIFLVFEVFPRSERSVSETSTKRFRRRSQFWLHAEKALRSGLPSGSPGRHCSSRLDSFTVTPPDPALDFDRLTPLVHTAVREAGAIALGFFENGARRWSKADASPVTEGDIAVDHFLRERLPALFPGIGWLSEETADTPDRLTRRRVWVVDPIDGTRAFAEGIPMWVISVALVEDGRPVLAAVLNPVTDEFFCARLGGGAFLNGAAISSTGRGAIEGARISGPQPLFDRLAGSGAARAPWIYALAYRFVHVAAGRIDAATARTNAKDWDVAGADLILSEAGARLTDLAGRTLVYNRPQPSHPALIAAGSELHPALVAALAEDGAPSPS
jgi:myo-inositol-1(or 4)-monophosphatase